MSTKNEIVRFSTTYILIISIYFTILYFNTDEYRLLLWMATALQLHNLLFLFITLSNKDSNWNLYVPFILTSMIVNLLLEIFMGRIESVRMIILINFNCLNSFYFILTASIKYLIRKISS